MAAAHEESARLEDETRRPAEERHARLIAHSPGVRAETERAQWARPEVQLSSSIASDPQRAAASPPHLAGRSRLVNLCFVFKTERERTQRVQPQGALGHRLLGGSLVPKNSPSPPIRFTGTVSQHGGGQSRIPFFQLFAGLGAITFPRDMFSVQSRANARKYTCFPAHVQIHKIQT